METLEIDNFLTIKHAKVEIRRYTIFIGPQANGKSVIAKLIYFFRNFLNTQFIRSIERHDTKRELVSQGIVYFEQIFPKYTWLDQDFKLVYRNGDNFISLSRRGVGRKKTGLNLEISESLLGVHRKAKYQLKRKLEDGKRVIEHREPKNFEVFWQVLREYIYDAPVGNIFLRSVFIPASRSFFANLQKNVFSFLANNIAIDPLIKEFGSAYESSKRSFNRRPLRSKSDKVSELQEKINQEIENILTGRYLYQDDQDWIISDSRKINLANASSGQQEALPLLIVLKTWIDRLGAPNRPTTFFIEEPEAHLFPVSQKRLVNIFSRLYNEYNFNFVLTTHSPYILTALNNLIMASNLVHEKKGDVTRKVENIIGKNTMIAFEDVSAYTIHNGQLENFLDTDSRLIGSSIIDAVSDEFDRVFDKLMQIEIS